MVFWIRKAARMSGLITFFILFFFGLDPMHPFDPVIVGISLFKGLCGAVLFWFAGFVLSDVVFKGMVSDVHTDTEDAIDGGLLQRIHNEKTKLHPDSILETQNSTPEKSKKNRKK